MPTTTNRPNILFLFTDDQRHDTIHALGNDVISTPAMDSLVERGTAFTNAYIMGGTAAAVCMPSRAMLMSGRSLFRLEGRGERIPQDHPTFPEVFRAAGYHTHHIGKWHQDRASFTRSFASADRIFGFTKGWYETYGGHWNVAVHDYDPSGEYPEESGYMLAADKKTKVPIGPGAGGVHSSELFADAAVEFLSTYEKDEPFLLYVSFVAPHDPRQSPNEFESMYGPANVAVPENFLLRHPFDNGDLFVRDERLEGWPRRERAIQDHLADYYGIISHVDSQIGRILAALKGRGLADDTIIVFSGDNGLAVGQHGLMGKQSVYEHSVGVPLLFAGPGIEQGRRSGAPCYLFDIYPTLCELAGVEHPESVDGMSLVGEISSEGIGREPRSASRADTIESTGNSPRAVMVYGYQRWQRAVRSGNLKLIEYAVDGQRFTQLFDLESDPLEMDNLAAADPLPAETGEQLRRMWGLMASQLEAYEDPWRSDFRGEGRAIPQKQATG